MGIKSILLTATALVLSTSINAASITVISDVDAPNIGGRPQNLSLLENVRNNGNDILWLTGGYAFDYRYPSLRDQWNNTAGVSVTTDLTSNIDASLIGRDLVVINAKWEQLLSFDANATTDIGNYLAGGGDVLFIGQYPGTPDVLQNYNTFLTQIGSSIQFTVNYGSSGNADFIDTNTSIGQGVAAFNLNGWSGLTGGITVVSDGGLTGVAYEDFNVVPVPAAVWLFGSGLIGLIGVARRKKA